MLNSLTCTCTDSQTVTQKVTAKGHKVHLSLHTMLDYYILYRIKRRSEDCMTVILDLLLLRCDPTDQILNPQEISNKEGGVGGENQLGCDRRFTGAGAGLHFI